jgi:hypothetical protein
VKTSNLALFEPSTHCSIHTAIEKQKCCFKWKPEMEDVREYGADKDIWVSEIESKKKLKKTTC